MKNLFWIKKVENANLYKYSLKKNNNQSQVMHKNDTVAPLKETLFTFYSSGLL